MAGIYIHIPFCKKACHYCNFHFSTSSKLLTETINAIAKETHLRKNYINETVDTIYFGGGTPSILKSQEIIFLLNASKENFIINPDAEITLEANPDDILEEKLLEWKSAGINRLSLGIQSFVEEELVWMNRSHNSRQAIKSIELIKKHFKNYSVDLIFGSQMLSNEKWIENIETTLSFNPPHISCYGLTIEEKTVFGKLVAQKQLKNIDENKQAEQFETLMNKLSIAGYEQYEISNYALKGFESKHNSSYWQGKNYLGLGPSAHSFDGNSRSWNIANNALYISSLEQGELNCETELLTQEQKFNEYVMISLRMSSGINLKYVQNNWGENFLNHIEKRASKWLKSSDILISSIAIQLTQKGKLFADRISSDFFF